MQTQKMRDDLSLLFVFCLAYFAILVATIFADFKIDSRSIGVLNSFIFASIEQKSKENFFFALTFCSQKFLAMKNVRNNIKLWMDFQFELFTRQNLCIEYSRSLFGDSTRMMSNKIFCLNFSPFFSSICVAEMNISSGTAHMAIAHDELIIEIRHQSIALIKIGKLRFSVIEIDILAIKSIAWNCVICSYKIRNFELSKYERFMKLIFCLSSDNNCKK